MQKCVDGAEKAVGLKILLILRNVLECQREGNLIYGDKFQVDFECDFHFAVR